MNPCYFSEKEANLKQTHEKLLFSINFSLLIYLGMQAQTTDTSSLNNHIKGKSQAIAFGIYMPIGIFSKSHIAGAGIDYSRSHHRFGRNISPRRLIGFIVNGGIIIILAKE